MKLGCEAFVDFTQVKDVAEEVVKICDGKGAHGIFVTATSGAAYASAPLMARIGGKIVSCFTKGVYGSVTANVPFVTDVCWTS